jgi:transcriptional regulator with XRE-family HTH domain
MTPLRFHIRDLRTARQWSQAQLAEKAGVRQATISGLETGQTRRVDLDVLERIGAALGVDPASLLVSVPRTSRKRPARQA